MRFLKVPALMAVMLFSAVMMLGVLSLRGLPVRGGGGGLTGAKLNGDVNCDGKRNVTDAIALLEYIFKGGPEPCALAQETEVLDKLNALGDQITALQNSVATLAPTWPPKTEDLVNLIGKDTGKVYTVPAGKTLVLTSIRYDGDSNSRLLINGSELDDFFNPYGSGGIGGGLVYVSASGLPLGPGTAIAFRGLVHYRIIGYLRDA